MAGRDEAPRVIRVWREPAWYAAFVAAVVAPLCAWRVAAVWAATDLLPLPLDRAQVVAVALLGVVLAAAAGLSLARRVDVALRPDGVVEVRPWPAGDALTMPLEALRGARVEPVADSELARCVATVDGRDVVVAESTPERLARLLDAARATG